MICNVTKLLVLGFMTIVFVPRVDAESELERRRQYLADALFINVKEDHRSDISREVTLQDQNWRDWQNRTGELPPDFSQMRSIPFLPDPLEPVGGKPGDSIKSASEWDTKREWIKVQFQRWVSGTVPPAPDNLEAVILSDQVENRVRIQMIELRFGPDHKARMTFELLIPESKTSCPVYMTQWNHRDWAQLAVTRGYIGCVYAGADSKDDTQAYQALYPDYDFTCLMRRAWGASRVVDYLYGRPEVNTRQIAITGHSRNGKQSLWAGAFDERITAVVTSSCGTGGMTPWRYSDPQYCNQTLDDITANAAHWFHPRIRFFFGHEDKLPVDQNLLLSLIAPRALLLHYSVVERQLNPWANEQCFDSVKLVYSFLDKPDNIGLFPRMGEHAVAARDLEKCLDFLDIHFGRLDKQWTNERQFHYSFDDWQKLHAEVSPAMPAPTPACVKNSYATLAEFQVDRSAFLERLNWLLGTAPPSVKPVKVGPSPAVTVDWIDRITGRPQLKRAKVVTIRPYEAIGNHVQASLYYPANEDGTTRTAANGKVPVIIYLHQYAYAHGYALGYHRDGGRGNSRIFQKLTDAGFAVLAIDMFGFGARVDEAINFYRRFPQWSKMGKMSAEVSDCIDYLETMDSIDDNRIFVLGNTIGGSVGLLAAAQDERVAGVAAIAAFSPWRLSNSKYESIRLFSHQHGFMPKLGLFADSPGQVPVDYSEILSCIAPKPLLIIAPKLDRHSDPEAVKQAVIPVRNVYNLYGATENFVIDTPREINRLTGTMTDQVTEFFARY